MEYQSIAEDLRREAKSLGVSARRAKMLHMAEHFEALAKESEAADKLGPSLRASLEFLRRD